MGPRMDANGEVICQSLVWSARRKGRQNEGGNDPAVRDTQPVQGRLD
ncbi:hypothetical protein glysoja_042393 [Glycine soja]|uniref:Uncharacterized protein n=1 Tax=Glycine soja TaxID=3848 RepID=A0A0B2PF19_GLYSO|nr:hypothetical protein glysoja_042393 [Glycine soja]